MRKTVVKIPHIAWRDGRPRFSPGPALRALGFKGEDLKDAQGDWLDLRATQTWARSKTLEIEAANAGARERKKAKKAHAKLAGMTAARKKRDDMASFSIGEMFREFFAAKVFRDAGAPGCKSKTTAADYRSKADTIRKHDPELWTSPAASLTRRIVIGLHEALWEERGHAMANGVVAVLRAAYSAAQTDRDWLENPCRQLKLPPVQARLRVATPAEISALITAADELDDMEIGDAIVVALFTGQRQGDVLALEERAVEGGKIRFIQSKTGARVRVRALPQLVERLKAARLRRLTLQMKINAKAATKNAQPQTVASTIVVDSHTGRQFESSTFRHRFADVRERAAEREKSVETLLFLDLRDTAVTWLANAGATVAEIAAITGHSLKTVHAILKHYLTLNEEQADAAIDKLEAWMEAKGVKI